MSAAVLAVFAAKIPGFRSWIFTELAKGGLALFIGGGQAAVYVILPARHTGEGFCKHRGMRGSVFARCDFILMLKLTYGLRFRSKPSVNRAITDANKGFGRCVAA